MKEVSIQTEDHPLIFPVIAIVTFFTLLVTIFAFPLNSCALIGTKKGDPPADVILDDLFGKPTNVSAYYGKKPVVLVFWELPMSKSFLDYSMDELRFLNDYYEKHHDSTGLEIYGIYVPEEDREVPDREIERVRDSVTVNKIKFPVLIDRGYKKFREYGVIALPSTVMIDKTGKISFIYPSFPLAAQTVFVDAIAALIGLPRVSAEKETDKIEGHGSRSLRLYNYANQMYKKGLFEQAISPLNKAMELDSRHAPSHNLMGVILWKSGNYEGAVDEFEQALRLDRNHIYAHYNYGLLLIDNEKYDRAEEHIKTALSLDNSLAEAHYVLGMLYKNTARTADAIKEFEKALTLFGDKKTPPLIYDSPSYYRISALYLLSELYADNGDDKKTIELLFEAAKISLGLEGQAGQDHLHRSSDLMIHE